MSGKRVLALAGQYEQMAAFQPIPMDGSGKPPNKGIIADQIPRLPYCILVIDESPTVRGMVKVCLEREGMLVFDFPDGVQALQWLEEKICKPHVVLLNVDADEANWSPLIHHLQTQPAYAFTAIVVLSRNKGTFGRLQERLVGVQGSLTKPFHLQDLLHAIQRSLHVSQTR
jgi:DNA-binding response OmpR family regulator